MFIINEKLRLKKFVVVSLITLGVFSIDASLKINNAENVNEARFLGIGTKTTYGDCFSPSGLGGDEIRVVTKEFTIFGIRVGDSWDGGTVEC